MDGVARQERTTPSDRVVAARSVDRSLVLGLAALTFGAVLLRWPTLAGASLWFDEWYTRQIVSGSLLDVGRHVKGSESTPPLYYSIAWLWSNVFGTGEVALRSLSVVFGAAVVPVAYFTGATLVSPGAGWVAATLTATNPLLVWYSTEARAYSLLVLLSAVSLLLLARALTSPTRRTFLLWSATTALALATHYFSVFLIAGEIAVLLACLPRHRRTVVLACVPVGITGLLLAPLVYLQRGRGSWIDGYALTKRLEEVGRNFLSGVSIPNLALEILAAVLAFVLIGIALTGAVRERRVAWVMLAVSAVSLGIPILVALAGQDYVITRNVIASLLPLALVAAAGGASPRVGRVGYLLAASLVAVSLANIALVATDEQLRRVEWKDAARLLGEPQRDRLVIAWGEYRLAPLGEMLRAAERVGEASVVELSQIDILRFQRPAGQISCWSGAACNMVPVASPRQPPAAGFSLRERRQDGLFEVYRFTASEPRRIRIRDVLASLTERGAPYVWLQADTGR